MNDDILTLFYYNDGLSAEERQSISDALTTDAALAERYRRLYQGLSAMTGTNSKPLPADMLARFHDSIDRSARREYSAPPADPRPVHFMSFFWGAAVTAALAIGIGIGVWFGNGTQPVSYEELSANAGHQDAFTRSLQVHFRDSQAELSEMPLSSDADRILLVMDLIGQNRLYARAATHHDAPRLARVLRAFEPILLRLAAEDIAPEDAEALRAQLAFELEVMLTKLTLQTSEESGST